MQQRFLHYCAVAACVCDLAVVAVVAACVAVSVDAVLGGCIVSLRCALLYWFGRHLLAAG